MMSTPLLAAMFWLGIAGTMYAYVGFPALVSLVTRAKRRTRVLAHSETPDTLTIIIPAYNEEGSIETKIRNTLASDYARHLLEIIVVSDGSTDRTNDIARSFEPAGVRLLVQEQRQGKTAGLNRAVETARGDILVFTDANALYASDTLQRMTRHLRDPNVGLVSGYTRYRRTAIGGVSEVTNAYTSLERIIKRGESRWGACVGADGAIFAMRRSLYRLLRDDDINDFVLPLGVIDQGYECVFAEDAVCSENPGKNLESEFRRQSRITNRTLRALWRNAHLLNPIRFPVFAFFLFSHKVARFLVPIFMAVTGVALLLLAPTGGFYLATAIAVLAGVVAVALSRWLPRWRGLSRLFDLASVFATINLAILSGWWKFLNGHGDVTWQHDRSPIR
jgi:cellulose synthase/poly-beta-1,6-N-acetylglucosamine synthase-like glycosyltransferase